MSDKLSLLREIAHLERLAAERLDEISRLQSILTSEQDKTAAYSQQIDEMTDFLADYGLHWVGGPGPSHSALFPRGPPNMAEFMERISALNSMADAAPTMEFVDGVSRLCRPSVRIRFTDEGFAVNGGDLRPYAHPLSNDFFRDIMDGFFPAEFRANYPDGVTIVVEDQRRNRLFRGEARRIADPAEGGGEMGKGSGRLKIRLADGKETVVRVSENATVDHVREEIRKALGIEAFRLARPTGGDLDEGVTMSELGLFPKGVLLLIDSK
jgi:hypothetical protein